MMINRATMNHHSRRDPQAALKMRLRELAASRVSFGYRRLTVMLRREGWAVNAKRIYRLYTADGLAVRTKLRKKIARRARVPASAATRPNEKWSMDFVAARLLDGRWFRVLTVVDQFTRERLPLLIERPQDRGGVVAGSCGTRSAELNHGRQRTKAGVKGCIRTKLSDGLRCKRFSLCTRTRGMRGLPPHHAPSRGCSQSSPADAALDGAYAEAMCH